MTAAIRRGQIWIANLNPNRGREVGKIRPVLVVQGDWLTAAQSRTVIVRPNDGYPQPRDCLHMSSSFFMYF